MPSVEWDSGDKKQSLSVTVPCWLAERAKNAAAALADDPDPDAPINLSHFVSSAVYAEVLRWERLRNGGKPFPPGQLRLGPGRGAMRGAWRLRAAPEE